LSASRNRTDNAAAALVCGLLYVVYLWIYLPFLPNSNGTLGHDYGLHFPNLLTGYYWFIQNGAWSLPWFSPSQCGGFPYFPDPNVAYLSIPQFLVFFVPPMQAVQITFALFALAGLLGSYLLMRAGFRSPRTAAVVAAGFFLFNGFFAYRVLIGHLTFHAFMLVPLMIAALLSATTDDRVSRAGFVARACVAALCLAYMFQSGMVHGIPPVLIAAAAIILIHALCFGWQWQPWLLLGTAGLLSLLLCAGKLMAELALLSNFPRDLYPLPGIPGLLNEITVVVQALFVSPPSDASRVVTNSPWSFDRHEWEYGVSLGPLLLVAMAVLLSRIAIKSEGGTIVLSYVLWRHGFAVPGQFRVLMVAALSILLAVPIALNWYEPAWNGFLKSLPFLGNSSSLLRFFSSYIPIAIVVACLAFDRLLPRGSAPRALRLSLAAIALGVMVVQNVATDRDYYANQSYRIGPIDAEQARVRATGRVPMIEKVGDRVNQALAPNDAMIEGISQRACYQPLFGYRLERFPAEPLNVGPVISLVGDRFINMKDPACYLFPAENGCKPGDHFSIDRAKDAVEFLSYRPFAFEQPYRQAVATWLSRWSAIAVAAALLMSAALYLMRGFRFTPADPK
jgi:hypothetical protein